MRIIHLFMFFIHSEMHVFSNINFKMKSFQDLVIFSLHVAQTLTIPTGLKYLPIPDFE